MSAPACCKKQTLFLSQLPTGFPQISKSYPHKSELKNLSIAHR